VGRLKLKTIIIFTAGLLGKTGIYTWVRNFVANMRMDYNITILCQTFDNGILEDLMQFAKCDIYDKDRQYDCDIYLHNYQDNDFKGNIHARDRFMLLHCDYAEIGHLKTLQTDYKYIAVSETSAKGMREKFGIDCVAIEPFLNTYSPKRVYKFVSATRIHRTKGWDRMMQLCKLLTERGIRFQWLLFTDGRCPVTPYTGFLNMGVQPNEVVLDYMSDADYVVQLSDHEGFCYSVHEALSVGTPVLVSDIPVFDCIDETRGYRLPLDMTNIDLDKILYRIPKASGCSTSNSDLKIAWKGLLE